MEINKQKSCCFTGHRPEKLNISENQAKEKLTQAIKNAISDGYTTFISGMADGIDLWAAQIVLDEQRENPDIKLVCALPYPAFQKKNETVLDVLNKSDKLQVVCEHYSTSCFQMRNCYMVDNSNRVIAAFNGQAGGTKNTVKYAQKKQIEIVNIL